MAHDDGPPQDSGHGTPPIDGPTDAVPTDALPTDGPTDALPTDGPTDALPTDAAPNGHTAGPAAQHGGGQPTLFDHLPSAERPGGQLEDLGYRGPTACSAAGITYRQLDYWARTALVEPSVREAAGSGTQRLYSFRDILVLKIVKKLLDAGVSLQNIRTAISTLRDHGVEDLGGITLMSDGTTVYECTSTDEVLDLLQGGQAVFAIVVGKQVRDVEGKLAQLPGERGHTIAPGTAGPESGTVLVGAVEDELAGRRRRRTAG